ncbi:Scarecrow-like protein 6 [Dendrobium catenatum]|uniref:Scarecrow-like protein 6 n=1 Tax=Dendrobium catenatum TaxID=906689 RepID=A0A2I0XA34_9ASPA|nr:Scarecrow-like protein 6 [Dendrobium catenatum]
MKGMLFHALEDEVFFSNWTRKSSSKEGGEPRSVLDNRRSPSSPTSTSTPTCFDTTGVAAVFDVPAHKCQQVSASSNGEWSSELKPITMSLGSVEGWDSMLLEPPAIETAKLRSLHSFSRWFMVDSNAGARLEGTGIGLEILDPEFSFQHIGGMRGDGSIIPVVPDTPSNLLSNSGFTNNCLKAPAFANSNFIINQNPHENYMPKTYLGACAMPIEYPNESAWLQHAVIDLLFEAAELVESGNNISAQRILARLNHQVPPPYGKPYIRSAFYIKEALLTILNRGGEQCGFRLASPLDILLKLSAYKAFAEISPILKFISFSSTELILEELAGANIIHIIDFDVGVGSQWPALLQELSERRSAVTGVPLQLRITAFFSMSSHHQLELHLIQENLNFFAANLNVPFELNYLPIESFDPAAIISSSSHSGEVIAVNFAFGFCSHHISTHALLLLIKQLSPKILISANLGYDWGDLSFSHHVLHSFQSSAVLLDSIEESGVSPEITDRIEGYLLRPWFKIAQYEARLCAIPVKNASMLTPRVFFMRLTPQLG